MDVAYDGQQDTDRAIDEVISEILDAKYIDVSWIPGFRNHAPALTVDERVDLIVGFLGQVVTRIESSEGDGDFTLLVTDPVGKTGRAPMRWRLAGWITGHAGGTLFVKIRHYGPGRR